jgi:hypothetical protein
VVLDLLAEAMLKKVSGSKGFLIDGYPRYSIYFSTKLIPKNWTIGKIKSFYS